MSISGTTTVVIFNLNRPNFTVGLTKSYVLGLLFVRNPDIFKQACPTVGKFKVVATSLLIKLFCAPVSKRTLTLVSHSLLCTCTSATGTAAE